jgi:hypothetical protein
VDDALFLRLTAGSDGIAYAWTENGSGLYRIEGDEVTSLRSPSSAQFGLGVDPQDPDHALLGSYETTETGYQALLWETTNGGDTWDPTGKAADSGAILMTYRFSFDPNDLDHILVGTAGKGWVSDDGGASWEQSLGFAPLDGDIEGRANVFNFAVSPVDGDIVWAMAINVEETLEEPPLEGRYIYRSEDGGHTFAPVVTHGDGITLMNGPVMAAHPTDADVLYFVFGSHFNNEGTNLYRYEAGAETPVTWQHSDYDEYTSLAFHPEEAVIYIGLTEEGGGL